MLITYGKLQHLSLLAGTLGNSVGLIGMTMCIPSYPVTKILFLCKEPAALTKGSCGSEGKDP